MPARRGRARAGLMVIGLAAISVGLNTDFRGPPRYDGAGYSVLALSLLRGDGYREIDRPGAPPHAHFPPAYPIVLAGLWTLTGPSESAAHGLSVACTVAAAFLGWRWFLRVEPGPVANPLGAALAVNWTWAANGGAIQSEPLYLVLSLAAMNLASRRGGRAEVVAGLIVGAAILTRHVGVCLAIALVVERIARGRRQDAAVLLGSAVAMVVPWAVWLATVRGRSQAGLLDVPGLPARLANQVLFYARRLPDLISGPFVEVATVFTRSRAIGLMATLGAVAATGLIGHGLTRASIDPRRRAAGLVPLITLGLLLVWPFTEAGRFLVPLLPFVLVGAVEGIAGLGLPRIGRRAAALALFVVAIPYPAYSTLTGRPAAQRRLETDFGAACHWIATAAAPRPGPVLSRHPGEVFWRTRRLGLTPESGDLAAIAGQIEREGVAYLLIDTDRFANAPPTPLARFVADRPGSVRLRFDGPVSVYEVRVDSAP